MVCNERNNRMREGVQVASMEYIYCSLLEKGQRRKVEMTHRGETKFVHDFSVKRSF